MSKLKIRYRKFASVEPRKRRPLRKKPKPKRPARLYRMTVSTFWYNEETHQLSEYEAHFKIARRGDIRHIRRKLAEKGLSHFKRWLKRVDKTWKPEEQYRKIKVAFEKEQYARKEEAHASVRRLVMRRVKKRWVAKELASGTMRYSKRRRKVAKR